MSKVLILGSSGYIGKELVVYLKKNNFEVFEFNRTSSIENVIKNSKEYDVIINLCGSKGNADFSDSLKSNYEIPKSIFDEVSHLRLNKKTLWVQTSSYYELQLELGRKSWYAIHKNNFKQYLTQNKDQINSSILYLPHIFGGSENENRLIPLIINASMEKKMIELGDRSSFLPLLHIQDLMKAILITMETGFSIASASPVWKGSLEELVDQHISPENKQYVKFKENPLPLHKSPIFEFPEPLVEFKPQITLKKYLNHEF